MAYMIAYTNYFAAVFMTLFFDYKYRAKDS